MVYFSTRQAAKKLGISHNALAQYVRIGKVPAPQSVTSGGATVHIWTESEIEHVRKLLPKIANGRKTRYQKRREAQARAPVLQKTIRRKSPTRKKKPQPKKK